MAALKNMTDKELRSYLLGLSKTELLQETFFGLSGAKRNKAWFLWHQENSVRWGLVAPFSDDETRLLRANTLPAKDTTHSLWMCAVKVTNKVGVATTPHAIVRMPTVANDGLYIYCERVKQFRNVVSAKEGGMNLLGTLDSSFLSSVGTTNLSMTGVRYLANLGHNVYLFTDEFGTVTAVDETLFQRATISISSIDEDFIIKGAGREVYIQHQSSGVEAVVMFYVLPK